MAGVSEVIIPACSSVSIFLIFLAFSYLLSIMGLKAARCTSTCRWSEGISPLMNTLMKFTNCGDTLVNKTKNWIKVKHYRLPQNKLQKRRFCKSLTLSAVCILMTAVIFSLYLPVYFLIFSHIYAYNLLQVSPDCMTTIWSWSLCGE